MTRRRRSPARADVALHDEQFAITETAIRDCIRATRFAELARNIPTLPDGLVVSSAGTAFIATT